MNLKLKIKKDKNSKRKRIFIWIQRHKDINQDFKQILEFFKEQIIVSKKRKILPYYRITSDNPAILLSLFTAVQELIPEIYFKGDDSLELQESINS